MNLIAVCVSSQKHEIEFPVPLYCHTEGYKPISSHDNRDRERLEYLTERYNGAVERALSIYPQADHLLLVDSYYLSHFAEIEQLIREYREGTMMGASIWYWDRSHIRPVIRYYDTLSVKDFRRLKWRKAATLPTGIIPVSGVGACWIMPRESWEGSNGFFIPTDEPQAGGSSCLRTTSIEVLLDCNVRLWRTHDTNPDIPEYSWPKRFRMSLGEWRRRMQSNLHREAETSQFSKASGFSIPAFTSNNAAKPPK